MYFVNDLDMKQEYMDDSKFQETVFDSMKLSGNDYLLVCLMYISQSSGLQNTNRCNTLMSGICNKGFSYLLMVGDFNLRNANWDDLSLTCDVTNKFIDTTLDNYMCKLVDRPTHYRGDDTPSTIDFFH